VTRIHIGVLITIIICTISLRFYGLDWGTNHQTGHFYAFHPDEQTLIDSASHIGHNMRDIVASYGKAPMYLLSITAHTIGYITNTTPFTEETTRFTHLVARNISAILSTLTVCLTFLIGRQISNTTTGLVSALFLAFCAGHIQQSHYYTVDISLTFWITLALYIALQLPTSKTLPYIAFGIAIGLATGTRLVGIWMAIPFALIHILQWPQKNQSLEKSESSLFTRLHLQSPNTWKKTGIAVATGMVFLFICEPFLILDPALFFKGTDTRQLVPSMQIAQGELIRIWTLYDFSTTPYLFYLTHLLRDALGYPLELTAGIGLLLAIYHRAPIGLILLGWIIPYFLTVGGLHTKPIRYVTPLLPSLCILGAYATNLIGQKLPKHLPLAPLLPSMIIALPTIMYGLALTSIYGKEDSRISAAQWITQNIPQNASVLTEPGGFPTTWMTPTHQYRVKTDQASYLLNTEGLIPYWEQITYIQDQLKTVDWIISVDENRARQFAGVPTQYPIGHTYYQKLKEGHLGFTIDKQFQVMPTLWGWSFHHTDSDPTMTAYDHPQVTIYKRTGNVDQIIASWQKEIKQDSAYPDHAFIAGIQAYKNQSWNEAQKAFQKACDIRPNYLLSHIMIVNSRLKSGHAQEADILWKKLETEFGGIPDEIGMGLSKAGLYYESILYLERSLALYAQQGSPPLWLPQLLAESRYALGLELIQKHHYEEAKTAFKKVIEYDSNHGLSYQALGKISLLQNQPQEALELLEKALIYNLKDAETWYLMGQAYDMQKKTDNAQFYFHQAMGLAPQEKKYRNTFEEYIKPK
jgi:tetratricopeptide (TPR) repeat protein